MGIFLLVILAIVFSILGIEIFEQENIRSQANKRESIIETEEKKAK